MGDVLGPLAAVLDRYGYLAVLGLVFVEGFGLPAPGQLILIAAGAYASTGRLNVVLVAVLGWAAATAGDNVGFAIGHFGGRPLLRRFGRYVLLPEHRLRRAEDMFQRHGAKLVTVARFVDGLRQTNGVIAGSAGMPWWQFLTFNALGAALWAGPWVTVGYLAGRHLNDLYQRIRHYELYVIGVVTVAVVAFVAYRTLRSRSANSNTA